MHWVAQLENWKLQDLTFSKAIKMHPLSVHIILQNLNKLVLNELFLQDPFYV